MGMNQNVRCGWKPEDDPELAKPEFLDDEEPERKAPPERPLAWTPEAPAWREAPAPARPKPGPPAPPPGRLRGTVRNFERGFGFIHPDEDPSRAIFVHQTAIRTKGYRDLRAGQRVEFTMGENDKGKCAVKVTLLPRSERDEPE